ncbi:hypothetical protein H0H93_000383 [Arthromyces matolae]|nr:hypothetical protein H0H93_000383 [Arthromyces matolae]
MSYQVPIPTMSQFNFDCLLSTAPGVLWEQRTPSVLSQFKDSTREEKVDASVEPIFPPCHISDYALTGLDDRSSSSGSSISDAPLLHEDSDGTTSTAPVRQDCDYVYPFSFRYSSPPPPGPSPLDLLLRPLFPPPPPPPMPAASINIHRGHHAHDLPHSFFDYHPFGPVPPEFTPDTIFNFPQYLPAFVPDFEQEPTTDMPVFDDMPYPICTQLSQPGPSAAPSVVLPRSTPNIRSNHSLLSRYKPNYYMLGVMVESELHCGWKGCNFSRTTNNIDTDDDYHQVCIEHLNAHSPLMIRGRRKCKWNNECNCSYSDKRGLERHISSTHVQVIHYCPFEGCEAFFFRKEFAQAHVKTVHGDGCFAAVNKWESDDKKEQREMQKRAREDTASQGSLEERPSKKQRKTKTTSSRRSSRQKRRR